jgi:hypothetical protein
MQLSYELRPGARSRRGPRELWDRFDEAVANLGEAFEGRGAQRGGARVRRAVRGRARARRRDRGDRLAGRDPAPRELTRHRSGASRQFCGRKRPPSGDGVQLDQATIAGFSQLGAAGSSMRSRAPEPRTCSRPKCSNEPTISGPSTSHGPNPSALLIGVVPDAGPMPRERVAATVTTGTKFTLTTYAAPSSSRRACQPLERNCW